MVMRKDAIGSAILLVVVALLILRPWQEGPSEPPRAATAAVVRVVDGDTIEARIDGEEDDVRLIGVDTPETVKPDAPVECFGPRASAFTHRLLEGRTVRLRLGVETRDVYGRLLAYVWLGRRFVNAELVRRGLARSLTIPPNDGYAPLFQRLERRAARAGRGLWGACAP
jgi:micrococcal nuclease